MIILINNANNNDYWIMLEACGTILSALVALISIIYFEFIKPKFEQPKLVIIFKKERKYSLLSVIPTNPSLGIDSPTCKAYYIRVGVKNISKIPARNVRIKFSRLADENCIENLFFISYDLSWTDLRIPNREILVKNEEALADLFMYNELYPDAWWFQPHNSDRIGFGSINGLPLSVEMPDKAFIELTALADNMNNPLSTTFEISYEEPYKIGKFIMEKSNNTIISQQEYFEKRRRNPFFKNIIFRLFRRKMR
jgi:hypothetical protein